MDTTTLDATPVGNATSLSGRTGPNLKKSFVTTEDTTTTSTSEEEETMSYARAARGKNTREPQAKDAPQKSTDSALEKANKKLTEELACLKKNYEAAMRTIPTTPTGTNEKQRSHTNECRHWKSEHGNRQRDASTSTAGQSQERTEENRL
ncbi:hypothetical protein HPB47_001048 [Ixodes persulcatus]|uniref:Uncharacterized protein n=1 Tax=Ixodes persulcatus TaxID=34615 RepID=A0AC60PQ44_IXOPE|nr:hypothetical protein HPB47_001048 [Ixodes persulcatus]